jgi:hypothetical protein
MEPNVDRAGLPRVFIGSSREQIDFTRAVREQLKDVAVVTLWCDGGVFTHPNLFIDDLSTWAGKTNYAVMVFGSDDEILHREKQVWVARDNVILEMGLFIGRLGRANVLYVAPEDQDWKRPTDFLGLAPIYCKQVSGRLPVEAAAAVAERIRAAIDATWRPVPPALSARLQAAEIRLQAALEVVKKRLCHVASATAPSDLGISGTTDWVMGTLAVLGIGYPVGLGTPRSFEQCRDLLEDRQRSPGWSDRLTKAVELMEKEALNLERWASDADAWVRLQSYAEAKKRHDAVSTRCGRATVDAARLLAAATGMVPPVAITDASASSVLLYLANETGVRIECPRADAPLSYAWPDDGCAIYQDSWLVEEERRVTAFESFIGSERTAGLLGRSQTVLKRFLRAVLNRLAELRLPTASLDESNATIGDIPRVQHTYISSPEGAADSMKGRFLSLVPQRLDALMREISEGERSLDDLAAVLDSMEKELDSFERWPGDKGP